MLSISEHFQPLFRQIELQVPAKILAEIRNIPILAEVFVYPKQKAPAFDVGRRFFHLITDYYLISLTLITSSLDSTAVFTDSGTLSAETIV